MTRNLSLWLASLILTAGAVRGQDAYSIRVKDPGVGDTAFVQQSETTRGRTVVTDAAGKQVFQVEETSTEVSTYRETVLAKQGSEPPTLLKRRYEKAQTQTGGKIADLVYAGKTILIENKAGKYRFRFENGRDLTAEEARVLDKEFNRDGLPPMDLEKLLLPKVPVRLKDGWRLDMKAVSREFVGDEMEVDTDRSAGSGALNKVYRQGENLFGELAFQMDLPLKAMGKGKDRVVTEPGSKAVFQISMDLCIDGLIESAALTGAMKLSATTQLTLPDGKPGKAVISLEVQSQEVQRAVQR